MSRSIVLDCETTGLDHKVNRVIEIGCVELFDYIPTGNEFHVYINPNQIMDQEVIDIHGITNESLIDKPLFSDIYKEFLDFISNSPLIAHNAKFDMDFINEEMNRINQKSLTNEIIDTLEIARKLYGTGNSLDNLCRRYNVNNSIRKKHGALLDAQILSKVYFFLLQDYNIRNLDDFSLMDNFMEEVIVETSHDAPIILKFKTRSLNIINEEDRIEHHKFMNSL